MWTAEDSVGRWCLLALSDGYQRLFLGGALVLAGALGLGVVLAWVRRQAGKRLQNELSKGFTIDDLERMRASGQISEQEFRLLRKTAMRANLGGDGKNGESSLRPQAPRDDEARDK